MRGEVTVEVVIDDGAHAGPGRRTALRLTWTPTDPCAVQLRLTALPDHPALPRGQWVVLRDFLRDGLDGPTGDGAVQLRPDEARDRVWFELARPGRAVCVSVPRGVVRTFLQTTTASVPLGEERTEAAVEQLLERVLYS
jgi:hypothetical protein